MIWRGRIETEAGRVAGVLGDEFGWELTVVGSLAVANRMTLTCMLRHRGQSVDPGQFPATLARHVAVAAPGARFTGELVRGSSLGATRWRGSVSGPWPMRLVSEPWSGRGPIDLLGEPIT